MAFAELFWDQPTSRQKKIWLAVILAALLWHLMVFLLPWQKWFFVPRTHAPVQITPFDARQVEAIRKQWKDKKLLISKDQTPAQESEAPKDARYMSDRNVRVEKETRARETRVLPTPAERAQQQMQQQQPPSAAQSQTFPRQRAVPLSNLGVPMSLSRPAPKAEPFVSQNSAFSRPWAQNETDPGDQALDEKNLPYGAENMLNSEQSVYYTFYSRMYQAIGPVWESQIRSVVQARRLPEGEYLTQVDVVLDDDGRVVQINYLVRSGVGDFDQAVEQAWRKIGRFPNPPREHFAEDGYLHTGWTFRVDLTPGMGYRSAPPSREY